MSWSDAESRFAENFQKYEPREHQRGFATAIETALADEVHGLFQAGCGVGKSFGAMVPAIDHALATGKPVIAATATRALQDQYLRDMATLQTVYREFSYTILKGRSNYLCRAKLDTADDSKISVDMDAVREAMELDDVWGDVDQLPVTLAPADRAQLVTSSDECPGKNECVFGERCFAEGAKARAAASDVIITNHSLVAIDAQLKHEGIALLPVASAVIIDEAHEFPEYVTNSLGSTVSERTFTSLAREVGNFLADSSYTARTQAAAQALIGRLGNALGKDTSLALTPAMVIDLGEEIAEVLAALEDLETGLGFFSPQSDGDSARKKRLLKRVTNLTGKVQAVVLADFTEVVRWTERDEKRGVVLAQAPLDIAPFLQAALWPWAPAVLISATLAVGDDFSYLATKLGLDIGKECRTFDAGSPFDFTTQARLYIPSKDFPKPTEQSLHRVECAIQMGRMIKAADGRALLLFTSWRSLNASYDALTPMIESLGHQVLRQGEMSTRKLAQAFADDEHSVLFAVKSFFTGLDISGDALRLVCIDKIPFPNPSDIVFAARCAALDARVSENEKWTKGAFPALSVPEATLTLQQIFGRLIRSMTDQGLVAIMDSRLRINRYGKKVIGALPPAPLLDTVEQAESYLQSLDAVVVS